MTPYDIAILHAQLAHDIKRVVVCIGIIGGIRLLLWAAPYWIYSDMREKR